MGKRFELLPDEMIIIEQGIHWKNVLSSVFAGILCELLVLLRSRNMSWSVINRLLHTELMTGTLQAVLSYMEIIILTILAFACIARIIQLAYIRYYVTDKRIIAISGIVARKFSEMLLEKCEMVYLNQNPYERIYNCGDILCVSAGGTLFLDDVSNANAFKQTLMSLITKNQN